MADAFLALKNPVNTLAPRKKLTLPRPGLYFQNATSFIRS
jgi:hypothetical protein